MSLTYLLHAQAPMKVLVGCEFSGTVRDAFLALGHDAWSCDKLPDEKGSNRHIRGDVREVQHWGWDLLMVAHPPCTRLCNSGVRWLHEPPPGKTHDQMWDELQAGADLFSDLWNGPVERIAIENPKMHKHAKALIRNYQEATQTVQPWWWGEPCFKGIGLYLKNLPALVATNPLTPPKPGTEEHKAWSRIHRHTGWGKHAATRWKERSRFFPGVSNAMAAQWAGEVIEQRRAA